MRYSSIATHLRPYVMLARRRTTINHAFAAAVAPNDEYADQMMRSAIIGLGQDPDRDLRCVYCDMLAETWDHILATVKDSRFSGHGHTVGNLLPCCKPCNSRKGNKAWESYLATCSDDAAVIRVRHKRIAEHLKRHRRESLDVAATSDHERLDQIRLKVLILLGEGDEVAARIRAASSGPPDAAFSI